MGNPVKGEVSFQACGATYTLKLDYNALCVMEEEIPGDHNGDLGQMLRGPRSIRSAFRIGLQAHHQDLKDPDVGNILTDIGLPGATAILRDALKWAMPEPAAESNPRPRPPAGRRADPSGKTTS